MDTVQTIATYASFVIAGLIVILNGIAPLTSSDIDNKILSGLRWFEDTVLKMILPTQTANVAAGTPSATPAAK